MFGFQLEALPLQYLTLDSHSNIHTLHINHDLWLSLIIPPAKAKHKSKLWALAASSESEVFSQIREGITGPTCVCGVSFGAWGWGGRVPEEPFLCLRSRTWRSTFHRHATPDAPRVSVSVCAFFWGAESGRGLAFAFAFAFSFYYSTLASLLFVLASVPVPWPDL